VLTVKDFATGEQGKVARAGLATHLGHSPAGLPQANGTIEG